MSMSLAWCFLDERPESAVAVLTQVTDTGALVPALWHLEIANAWQAAAFSIPGGDMQWYALAHCGGIH
jgi:hypothetical protein